MKTSTVHSHARPFADFRDAHTPVRLPTHRDLVEPRSRVQAGAKSVAAPLVRADARNIEVLTDSQPVNTVGDLAVLARLLDSWTEIGVLAVRCSVCCRMRHRQLARQGRNRARRSSCAAADRIFPALRDQAPAYEIQIGAVAAAMRMQGRGFKFDIEAHAQLIADLKLERLAAEREYREACLKCGQRALADKNSVDAGREGRTPRYAVAVRGAQALGSDGEIRRAVDQAQRAEPRRPLSAGPGADQAFPHR